MAAPAGEHASSTARTDDSACHPTVSSAKSGTPTLFERLGRPRHVMAPMVHGSELPFRMLCRRYGCQLCYTPMWNAALVRDDPEYAAFVIKDASCPDDRPLIMQFQASSGKDLLAAAEIVAPYVDAVDLNLGCPQTCAQKGGYGASLMDNLPKVARIVKTAAKKSPVPITAKIRVFRDDEQATVAYARLLEQAGAQMLTVHGRGREDREAHQLANWDLIRAVKRAVRIPVLANGNILYYPDIPRCLKHTGCDGVMVANALLWDPRLFTNPALPLVTGHLFDMCAPADALGVALAKEYLECVRQHPTEYLYVLHHIKRLLYNCAHYHPEMIVRLLQLQVNIVGDQSAPTSQTLIQKLEPLLDTLESQVKDSPVPGRKKDPNRKMLGWLAQPRQLSEDMVRFKATRWVEPKVHEDVIALLQRRAATIAEAIRQQKAPRADACNAEQPPSAAPPAPAGALEQEEAVAAETCEAVSEVPGEGPGPQTVSNGAV